MADPMSRRDFLGAAGASAAVSIFPRDNGEKRRDRPNIVVIVADDLGYADVGVQGCRDVPTPNIDAIARSGVRFTNGYVSCPVCSPTRAGLLTGRYQQRFGHEFNPGPAEEAGTTFGLPLDEVTIADRLKAAGYATGLVGKWHLGYLPQYNPTKRGFDEFFGFLGGAHPYLPGSRRAMANLVRGTEPIVEREYLTDAFGREAAAFVDAHASAPFYLQVTFNAVHMPAQATRKYLDRFPKVTDPKRRTLAAKLSAMDDAVGLILGRVRSAGLEKDTLVIFHSDNGAPPANGSLNTPLRGWKAQVWEGGIRIPYAMRWPGRIPAGKVYDDPVIQLDIHPTCLAAAGASVSTPPGKALDGVNLLPFVSGKDRRAPHEWLFWRFGALAAARHGNHKLVRIGETEQCFDLRADVSEKSDLAPTHADIHSELAAGLDKWESELREPLWGPRGRRAGPRLRALLRRG